MDAGGHQYSSREATEAPQTARGARASPTGHSHQRKVSFTRKCFKNSFRNVTRERPPRPRLFGTGPFFDGAAAPPLQGGECARLNFIHSFYGRRYRTSEQKLQSELDLARGRRR